MIKRESMLNEHIEWECCFVQLERIPLLYYLVCSSLASALVLIPVQQPSFLQQIWVSNGVIRQPNATWRPLLQSLSLRNSRKCTNFLQFTSRLLYRWTDQRNARSRMEHYKPVGTQVLDTMYLPWTWELFLCSSVLRIRHAIGSQILCQPFLIIRIVYVLVLHANIPQSLLHWSTSETYTS